MADKTQKDLDQLVKKYSHVPVKGGWEVPRKLFHYSIGEFLTDYAKTSNQLTHQKRICCIIFIHEWHRNSRRVSSFNGVFMHCWFC